MAKVFLFLIICISCISCTSTDYCKTVIKQEKEKTKQVVMRVCARECVNKIMELECR